MALPFTGFGGFNGLGGGFGSGFDMNAFQNFTPFAGQFSSPSAFASPPSFGFNSPFSTPFPTTPGVFGAAPRGFSPAPSGQLMLAGPSSSGLENSSGLSSGLFQSPAFGSAPPSILAQSGAGFSSGFPSLGQGPPTFGASGPPSTAPSFGAGGRSAAPSFSVSGPPSAPTFGTGGPPGPSGPGVLQLGQGGPPGMGGPELPPPPGGPPLEDAAAIFTFRVKDFAAWWDSFHSFPHREKLGITRSIVARDDQDPERVAVIHFYRAQEADRVKAFYASDEFRRIAEPVMSGPPDVLCVADAKFLRW